MKTQKLSFVWMMIFFSSFLLFSGCQSRQAKKQADKQSATSFYYTCSMHPQIHKDKPGNCPICGMKLIKVAPSANTKKMPLDSALSYLTEPVTQTVVGSFKVIEPLKTKPDDTITATGYIGFDERDVNRVNTRVTGRIEKLYVRYTNQRIRKGQPLMEVYSPQLLSAQRDLLQVMQDKDQTLINSLKEQLVNLGMHTTEIQKVIQSRKPLVQITIYSPYNGISQQTQAGQGMRMSLDNNMQNMGGSNMSSSALQTGMQMNMTAGGASMAGPASSQPELLNIREGMYVNRGQTVFTIQNINRTWAILNVFTSDVWHIHPGDAVSLYTDANPIHMIKGRVDFIPPYRQQDEKTTRIRVYLDHLPQGWKIGTLIHGQIAIHGKEKGWYVPLSAVNRLGMRSVVWVQDKEHANVFHAREVKTGIQTKDSIQIIDGIGPGDKIVENAAYMVDSDSFIE